MKATNVNLLAELKKAEFSQFREIFHELKYQKGQLIFTPYEEENYAFIVVKGRARIYLAYAEKEFTLSLLGKGELYSTHAECYVEALDDCVLLRAKVSAIAQFMEDIPALTRSMLRVLGRILKNSFSIIAGLAFKDISKRLAEYIIYKLEELPATETVKIIDLQLTMEQLAALMGSSRQTMSTILNDMERRGYLIKHGRGKYEVVNLALLRELAD